MFLAFSDPGPFKGQNQTRKLDSVLAWNYQRLGKVFCPHTDLVSLE